MSLVWAVNFGAQFVPGVDYTPDVSIHGIFMVVVGGALIASRRRADPDAGDLEMPDGVAAPPGLEQARRFAAEVLDAQIRAREQDQTRPPTRHRRRDRG